LGNYNEGSSELDQESRMSVDISEKERKEGRGGQE